MRVETIAKLASKKLKDLGANPYYPRVNLTPQHDGSAHIENIAGGKYRYVYSERGSEYDEKITDNVEDIFYWIYSDATFTMASDWEVKNRIENQDFRILLFQKQLDLLSSINEDFSKIRKKQIELILKNHPFT